MGMVVKHNMLKTHTGCDYAKGIHCRAIFHLFTALKQNLGGHELEDDIEVETAVTTWEIIQSRK
jgi:hypothetical protein